MLRHIENIVLGILIALIFTAAASAQSSPGFIEGQVLGATQLNGALQGKADYPFTGSIPAVGGVTFSGTPSAGYVPIATGATGAAWGGPLLLGSPYAVTLAINPYLSSASQTNALVNLATTSATLPETGVQSIVNSAVGGANNTTAFKIGVFGSCTAAAGSADCYGGNFVTQLSSGLASTITGIGLEVNINVNNANYGDAAGAPTLPYATNLYLAPGGANRATSIISVNCGANPSNCSNRGLVFWNGTFRLNTIEDYMTTTAFAKLAGTYTNGIDASGATISGNFAVLPNNIPIGWRNVANNATISAIKGDVNNNLVLGTGANAINSVVPALFTNAAYATNTNGQGSVGGVAANGAVLRGQGSTYDVVLQNSAGTIVANNPTGTTNFAVVGVLTGNTGLQLIGAAPTVSAGQIGFGGTTAANTNCGTLAGSAGCVVINVAGTTRYVPYY